MTGFHIFCADDPQNLKELHVRPTAETLDADLTLDPYHAY